MSPTRLPDDELPEPSASNTSNSTTGTINHGTSTIAANGLLSGNIASARPPLKTKNSYQNRQTQVPITHPSGETQPPTPMRLELKDGTSYDGFSFGAEKSIAGELVFQTGMVGYPESVTDPSYRGQILVITFPLIGNYGVPRRETMDNLLPSLPAHFESSEIHVAGLVVASYSGEDFSHHLASSSLGAWLKEQGVPAMYGVDTRALTKLIREDGSTLGRMLLSQTENQKKIPNGYSRLPQARIPLDGDEEAQYEDVAWFDPNTENLVAAGETALYVKYSSNRALTFFQYPAKRSVSIQPGNPVSYVTLQADRPE